MHDVPDLLSNLTPGPWNVCIDPLARENISIVGHKNLVCHLDGAHRSADSQVIAAAPELLMSLYLALAAFDQPELKRIAVIRSRAALIKAIGCDAISYNPAIRQLLRDLGVIEPTLSELALTTSLQLVKAWIDYAQAHDLGAGFVITQLRSGNQPPAPPPSQTWFTAEELERCFVR